MFARLADLAAYATWLPTSDMYVGTTLTSEEPLRLGSTYEDRSVYGAMAGEIVAFEEGRVLGFSQVNRKLGVRTRVTITYTLSDDGDGTHLHRRWQLEVPWVVGWAPRVLSCWFRKENERVLDALEASL